MSCKSLVRRDWELKELCEAECEIEKEFKCECINDTFSLSGLASFMVSAIIMSKYECFVVSVHCRTKVWEGKGRKEKRMTENRYYWITEEWRKERRGKEKEKKN